MSDSLPVAAQYRLWWIRVRYTIIYEYLFLDLRLVHLYWEWLTGFRAISLTQPLVVDNLTHESRSAWNSNDTVVSAVSPHSWPTQDATPWPSSVMINVSTGQFKMLSSGFQTLSLPWSQIPSLLNKLTSPNVQINNKKGKLGHFCFPKTGSVQNRLDTTGPKSSSVRTQGHNTNRRLWLDIPHSIELYKVG